MVLGGPRLITKDLKQTNATLPADIGPPRNVAQFSATLAG